MSKTFSQHLVGRVPFNRHSNHDLADDKRCSYGFELPLLFVGTSAYRNIVLLPIRQSNLKSMHDHDILDIFNISKLLMLIDLFLYYIPVVEAVSTRTMNIDAINSIRVYRYSNWKLYCSFYAPQMTGCIRGMMITWILINNYRGSGGFQIQILKWEIAMLCGVQIGWRYWWICSLVVWANRAWTSTWSFYLLMPSSTLHKTRIYYTRLTYHKRVIKRKFQFEICHVSLKTNSR